MLIVRYEEQRAVIPLQRNVQGVDRFRSRWFVGSSSTSAFGFFSISLLK
jgi:hypothetical protein